MGRCIWMGLCCGLGVVIAALLLWTITGSAHFAPSDGPMGAFLGAAIATYVNRV